MISWTRGPPLPPYDLPSAAASEDEEEDEVAPATPLFLTAARRAGREEEDSSREKRMWSELPSSRGVLTGEKALELRGLISSSTLEEPTVAEAEAVRATRSWCSSQLPPPSMDRVCARAWERDTDRETKSGEDRCKQ